jgi:hypothetical protein
MAELDSRPAKKRRFFVDGSSPRLQHPESSGNDSPAPVEVLGQNLISSEHQNTNATDNSFDVAILEAVVGRPVSPASQQRLKELSGGDIERGPYMTILLLALD